MRDANINDSLLVLAMGVFIGFNVIYDFIAIKGFYYVGNAFAWICVGYLIYRLMGSAISYIFLAVVSSQFLDELWGDPTKPSAIEYISFIGILFFFIIRSKNKKV